MLCDLYNNIKYHEYEFFYIPLTLVRNYFSNWHYYNYQIATSNYFIYLE